MEGGGGGREGEGRRKEGGREGEGGREEGKEERKVKDGRQRGGREFREGEGIREKGVGGTLLSTHQHKHP